ncbi:uncharacterized protein [Amphiura filiformis]|uniref:uncharacterized protein n=1 Tax=Amphiura filiformis TaxID=82378 RepID=UPI003B2226BF
MRRQCTLGYDRLSVPRCGKGFPDSSNLKIHEEHVHAFDDASSDEAISSDEDGTSKAPKQQKTGSRKTIAPVKSSTQPVSKMTSRGTISSKDGGQAIRQNRERYVFERDVDSDEADLISKHPNKAHHEKLSDRNSSTVVEKSTQQSDITRNISRNTDMLYSKPRPPTCRSEMLTHQYATDEDAIAADPGIRSLHRQRSVDSVDTEISETRSVFENFVTQTNVNIVVKHTCGKQVKETITSEQQTHFSSSERDKRNEMFSRLKSTLQSKTAQSQRKTNSFTNNQHDVSDDDTIRASPIQISDRYQKTSRLSTENRDYRTSLNRLESIERNANVQLHDEFRKTSRLSTEDRDFKTSLSRLESIQRNARLIADVLRRNRRGKTLLPKESQQPIVEEERLSSFESLLQSLDSSDSQWTKTAHSFYNDTTQDKRREPPREKQSVDTHHETQHKDPPRERPNEETHHETKHRDPLRRRRSNLETHRQTKRRDAPRISEAHPPDDIASSLDSYTSEEEPPPLSPFEDFGRDHDLSRKSSRLKASKKVDRQSRNSNTRSTSQKLTPEMKRHLHMKQKKKIYQCSKCDKSFVSRSNLSIHMKTHDKRQLLRCEYCNKGFAVRAGLERHIRTHTGEKPHKCKHCPKRFAERYSLTCHERIHTGVKPFKCLTCGMRFIESGSLTNHERCHSSERPYKCKYPGCSSAFKWSSLLKRHEQCVHRGVRYECEFCKATYARRETLRIHEKMHHSGSKPYLCHCGRRAANCEKHKEHKKKKHKSS